MRTTYNANKKRIQQATEKGQTITSKWAHYESMRFLDKSPASDFNSQDSDGSEETDDTQNVVPENVPENVEISQSVSNEWSLQEEEQVIFFYEDHPELWDHRRPDYMKGQKGQIMDFIIDSLDSKFTSKYIFYT